MKTTFTGTVTKAQFDHPFKATVTFILTDFQPNRNGQGIPREEEENIITSAIGMPIKYDPEREGHDGATPIGPIERAWSEGDIILAQATIWLEPYEDLAEMIRERMDSLGVSWEIAYARSEERGGVEWLYDTTVIGAAFVRTPAYGPRTPILALAEQQEGSMNDDIETLRAQYEELKHALAVAQQELRFAQRAPLIADVIDPSAYKDTISTMDDHAFALVLAVAEAARKHGVAKAEQVTIAPRPIEPTVNVLDILKKL